MSYTDVFSGSTVYPSAVSYLAVELTDDIALEWPTESAGVTYPAASIIDATPDTDGHSISLPDATQASPGQTILFNNLDGSSSFYVKDADGNTIATIDFGEQWQVYLADNTTAAGIWRVYRFGASTATVQPSALAGYGLTVIGSTLAQSAPVTTFSTDGLTVSPANRAGVLVWNDSGAGTLNLPTAASVGNNFFVMVRNEGGGDLTLDPAGTDTIDDAATLVLRPGDSAIVTTDGTTWFTVGRGQQAVFAFDYTSVTVDTGTYTLSGSELNRIAYKFVGALTGDVTVVVPSTVQQYWINNATSGAFSLFVSTDGGTPVEINQGAKGIYYCDGTDIILASDPTTLATPVTIDQGGTGAITASAARLNLGITLFADSIVTATDGATVLAAIGGAGDGANSDITSLSGLTTPLSVAQGGTGLTTLTGYPKGTGTAAFTPVATIPAADGGTGISSYAVGDILYASGATALSKLAGVATGNALISGGVTTAPTWGKIGLATHVSGTLPLANGGTNGTDAATARTSLGAQATLVSGTNIKTINGSSVLGSGDLSITTAPFAAGTKMLFVQTSAPTGWTKDTSSDNAALRVVSGTAGTGGSVNFTTAFASKSVSGTVGAHTLTIAEMPSHQHGDGVADNNAGTFFRGTQSGAGSARTLNTAGGAGFYEGLTEVIGGDGSHDHTFTGTSINLAVKYVDAIVATKT